MKMKFGLMNFVFMFLLVIFSSESVRGQTAWTTEERTAFIASNFRFLDEDKAKEYFSPLVYALGTTVSFESTKLRILLGSEFLKKETLWWNGDWCRFSGGKCDDVYNPDADPPSFSPAVSSWGDIRSALFEEMEMDVDVLEAYVAYSRFLKVGFVPLNYGRFSEGLDIYKDFELPLFYRLHLVSYSDLGVSFISETDNWKSSLVIHQGQFEVEDQDDELAFTGHWSYFTDMFRVGVSGQVQKFGNTNLIGEALLNEDRYYLKELMMGTLFGQVNYYPIFWSFDYHYGERDGVKKESEDLDSKFSSLSSDLRYYFVQGGYLFFRYDKFDPDTDDDDSLEVTKYSLGASLSLSGDRNFYSGVSQIEDQGGFYSYEFFVGLSLQALQH